MLEQRLGVPARSLASYFFQHPHVASSAVGVVLDQTLPFPCCMLKIDQAICSFSDSIDIACMCNMRVGWILAIAQCVMLWSDVTGQLRPRGSADDGGRCCLQRQLPLRGRYHGTHLVPCLLIFDHVPDKWAMDQINLKMLGDLYVKDTIILTCGLRALYANVRGEGTLIDHIEAP